MTINSSKWRKKVALEKDMLYLGVDGGGTKTTAVLCDAEGSLLKSIRLGPGNIAVLDRGSIAQLIRNIVFELLQKRHVGQITNAAFAFAGAGRPDEKKTVYDLIRALGIQKFSIMTDAEINYFSIFGEEYGILISAGTGSICLVKTADQKFRQIGGWGYLLGDEGSGFDIGRQAIKTALEEIYAENHFSEFTSKLLSFYGIEHPPGLISIIYSSVNPPKLIASCAKLICQLASKGEQKALKIAHEAAESLVSYAEQAIELMGKKVPTPYKLALTGGILEKNSIVNHLFKEKMKKKGYRCEYRKPDLEPAAAAVIYSIKQAGQTVKQPLLQKLRKITF